MFAYNLESHKNMNKRYKVNVTNFIVFIFNKTSFLKKVINDQTSRISLKSVDESHKLLTFFSLSLVCNIAKPSVSFLSYLFTYIFYILS